ncbi:MAG: pyridoxamine 5'-phosphate oxidase family protein [Candidatus Poribacteria bacterium]
MFRKITITDKRLNNAMEILKLGEYGVLATSGEDGYPYAVPLSYVYDNAIYFHCASTGHKIDNIKYNDKVSFCVVGRAKTLPDELNVDYQSVIVFGRARIIEGAEKHSALGKLMKKYAPESKCQTDATVVKIEIEHISAKGGK